MDDTPTPSFDEVLSELSRIYSGHIDVLSRSPQAFEKFCEGYGSEPDRRLACLREAIEIVKAHRDICEQAVS